MVLVALAASSCDEEQSASLPEPTPATVRTTRQEANSTRKVLILGSTISGGLQSEEAKAIAALPPNPTPFEIEVVTPAQWKLMSANQFMSYRALIIGDAACTQGTAAWQAALETRDTWGAIVDGNIIVAGSNLASNSWAVGTGDPDPVIQGAMNFATGVQRRTGMYVSLGCAYKSAPNGTVVELLSPFGEFKVAGMGCVEFGHVPIQYPAYFTEFLFDGLLIGQDNCAAKSVFTSYPQNDFSVGALALDYVGTMPSSQPYYDYDWMETFPGAPFILTRGAHATGLGCGGDSNNVPSGEECDLGDGGNGQSQNGSEGTCSWACKLEWCGDGQVQGHLGETCDNGNDNGRDINGNMVSGMCTRMCRIADIPAGSPPVARCKNVTVAAQTNACGVMASIDNGSSDPDNDLVACTQSPAGPYGLGPAATVTLTCTDQRGLSASCTGTVTVTDGVAPTLALKSPGTTTLECGRDIYTELGATASDACPAGDISSRIVITNQPSLTLPAKPVGNSNVNYNVKDLAGNSAPQVQRPVVVVDTLKPTINLTGQSSHAVECTATGSYVDPGTTVTDQCATIPGSCGRAKQQCEHEGAGQLLGHL